MSTPNASGGGQAPTSTAIGRRHRIWFVAAAEADPHLTEVVAPYVTMDALPAGLLPAAHRARRRGADSRRNYFGGVQDTGSRLIP